MLTLHPSLIQLSVVSFQNIQFEENTLNRYRSVVFGLNMLPWKSTLAGMVPSRILLGVVGLGGGGGMITQDRFILPDAPLQANGISLR